MSNQVDTSPETIGKEWARIESEYEAFPVDESEDLPVGTSENSEEKHYSPEEIAQKEANTSEFIVETLNLGFGTLGGLKVDEGAYKRFGDAWAKVIVKKYPDNPIDAFMEKYRPMLDAMWASFALVGAVREAAKAKEKEDIPRDQRVEQQQTDQQQEVAE